jgi:alpha-beta hydrolase superfamily lysophospholipase
VGARNEANVDELTVTDGDGVEVFYRRWLPEGTPRSIVLILHGASEHSGRYARFAEALTATGAAVYADDHRGHGRTGQGQGVGLAGPRGFDGVLDSIAAVQRRAVADVGDLPLVVFGHSMGSAITQVYAQVHADELAGFVLCGSMAPSADNAEMIAGLKMAVDAGMGDQPIDLLGTFNADFEPARTPFDWLSRDDAEVDKYLADPLCGAGNPLTYGYVMGVLGLLERGSDPEAIAAFPAGLPVLLITGEKDPVSQGGALLGQLEAKYRDAGLVVTSHLYPGARHELLNETNRDEVTADVLAWLDAVV